MEKKQIAQRIKNNNKPPSNAKAQLLLNTTGTNLVIPDILKFSFSNILDRNISRDFQVVLKKNNSMTKLKALKEFETLCDFKDVDIGKEVSAPWITQYVILCKDNVPCIHVNSQKAIRSYLNCMQPYWVTLYRKTCFVHCFVAQYGTHIPTASVAKSMFENTFRLNIKTEVIMFCQKNIFVYLIENITNSALLNTNVNSDEIKETQIRTAAYYMCATSTFLNSLPNEHIENIESDLKSMLHTNFTYWKLNKHPTPSVQQAWYTLLHSILFKLQRFLQEEYKNVAFAVFDNVDEDNLTVSLIIWKNILLVISKSDPHDFWLQSNIETIFFQKLWEVLVCTKGFISSANENILELCKHYPVMNIIEINKFHLKYINSIIQGFEKKSGRLNLINFVSGIEILFKIVNFTLTNNCKNELFGYKMTSEVINLIKFSLTEKLAKTMTPPVVSHVAVLLELLSKDNTFHSLKNTIWNILNTILNGNSLDDEIIFDNILCNLQVYSIILNHLKSLQIKNNKNLRVTFEDSNINKMFCTPKLVFNEDYKLDLENCVKIVIQFYFNRNSNTNFGHLFINHVNQVILSIKNYGVDKNVFQNSPVSNKVSSSLTFNLYENYVKTWIKADKILTNNSILVIFGLLDSITNEEEQVIIIEDLNLFGLDVVLKEIMKCIIKGYKLPKVIINWLETVPMQNEFKKFISIDVDENKANLLVNSLKLKNLNENIVCNTWMKVLLKSVYTNPTSSLVIMLRRIFENNLNDQSFVNVHLDLIINIMECLIRTYLEKTQDGDSKDQHELSQTWKLLLKNMLDTHNDVVIKKCSLIITNYVQLMEVDIEHVESSVNQFIEDFILCTKHNNLPVQFLYELFKCANNIDYSKAIKCCKIASYIDGSLSYTGNNINIIDASSECFHTVYALYSHTYVFTKQLLKLFTESEKLSDKSDKVIEQFVDIIANTICNVNVIATLLKCFSNRKYCCQIKSSVFEIIKINVTRLIQPQRQVVKFDVIYKIIEKTIINGPYWSKSLALVLDMLSLPTQELFTLYTSVFIKYRDSPNFIHIILVFESLYGMKYTYQPLSTADERCIINVHIKNTDNKTTIALIHKVWLSKEILSPFDLDFLTEEIKMVNVIRDIEFLNLIFVFTEQTLIEKFILKTYDRLISIMYGLYQELFNNLFRGNTCLPVGVMVALIGTLFGKLMEFSTNYSYTNEFISVLKTKRKLLRCLLVTIWGNLLNECNNCIHELVMESLSSCIKYFDFNEMEPNYFICLCSNLINSDCYIIEITAYNILDRLCELHQDYMVTDAVNDKVPFEFNVLRSQQDLVSTMMTNIIIGSTFEPEPFTIDFKNTRVYLLLWNVLLKLCSKFDSQERYKYISRLNNDISISCLMENLLKLMPNLIIQTYASNDVNPIITEWFNLRPNCTPTTYWNNKKLWHLVCWTYYNVLHTLPAAVRKWWVNREYRVSTLINRLTMKYVTPSLIIQEFQIIHKVKEEYNISVNLFEKHGTLVVSYMIDKATVDITIQMANNHPLGLIKVSNDRNMNMPQRKHQLEKFFSHQNGSIIDGILLWHLNIDKNFDGIEECSICYSILHDLNNKLPKSVCCLCHKKFHSSCLYKWFTTSNNSTCPICRNLF